MRKDVLLLIVLGVGLVFLANYKPEKSKRPTHFGTIVEPMDYEPTDTFVRNVYLDGNWLGSAGPGGSYVAGGVMLPSKWYPGLTATVNWERCEPFGKNCKLTEKKVLVHPYTRVGGTKLQIIEGEDILIIPTRFGTRHEDYPGPPPPHKDFIERKGITR